MEIDIIINIIIIIPHTKAKYYGATSLEYPT